MDDIIISFIGYATFIYITIWFVFGLKYKCQNHIN